jgi:hypothetical protein
MPSARDRTSSSGPNVRVLQSDGHAALHGGLTSHGIRLYGVHGMQYTATAG